MGSYVAGSALGSTRHREIIFAADPGIALSIIVVTYNSSRWLPALWASLRSQREKAFQVVVFDNASLDGTCAFLEGCDDALVIHSERNVGFAAACNAAARHATGSHLLFLNPDTRLEPNTIAEILFCIDRNPDAVIAPLQLSYDGEETLTDGTTVDLLGYPMVSRGAERPFYADGAAMVCPTSLFRLLGGFDEALFMFHEDIDLCWRAQLCGHQIIRCGRAVVRHVSGASAPGGAHRRGSKFMTTYFRRYNGEKNILRNILKNYSVQNCVWAVLVYLAQQACEIVVMCFFGRCEFARADFNAIMWNIENLRDTLETRSQVQKLRVTRDRDIFRSMRICLSKPALLRALGLPIVHPESRSR